MHLRDIREENRKTKQKYEIHQSTAQHIENEYKMQETIATTGSQYSGEFEIVLRWKQKSKCKTKCNREPKHQVLYEERT